MNDLHDRIMNLRAEKVGLQPSPFRMAYREGFRDARHAAAELASDTADPFAGEISIYRNGKWIMGINEPHISAVLQAIDRAIELSMFPTSEHAQANEER